MTDEAVIELRNLRQEFATLVASLSPWVTTTEMCARYQCTPKTLNNMERDGRIPFRINGRWSRTDLLNFGKKFDPDAERSNRKEPDQSLLRLLINATDPKPLPGVYFLLSNDGNVQYIGQSRNVLSRMHGHTSKEFDLVRSVVTIKTKTEARAQIPIGRIAAKLLKRPAFVVSANEGSVLFSKLCRELLIEGLTFHDTRGTALTHLARKVDVLTLAKISRHKDLSLLSNVYYRETPEQIAGRL